MQNRWNWRVNGVYFDFFEFRQYLSVASVEGYFLRINAGELSRAELWGESIESLAMNGFELCGIDAPLVRCDLQAFEDWWHCVVDVPALVAADDAAGPVHQGQVFLEVEQNTGLRFIYQSVFEVQQRL